MFLKNISPSSSGSKNKPSNERSVKLVAGLQDIVSQKIGLFITTAVRI
jgi:hypothetical protein